MRSFTESKQAHVATISKNFITLINFNKNILILLADLSQVEQLHYSGDELN